ncbi:MAG TPA: hypothetical protein PKV82_09380 [Anaerolineae bacterium]|nr:hypothetical protein [Anaerolineae bacterium]
MPRVPTYDGPALQSAPLRPPTARPLDVSSGTRAIGQGLAVLGEELDRQAERAAQAEAYDAEFRATDAWLKWDTSAREHARGGGADQYEADAEEWWSKAREEYGANLSPRAKALIGRSLQQKHLSAKANVSAFAGAERERHADEVAMADIATTIQFGVSSGTVDATRGQLKEKVAAFGARKNWSTEQVERAQGEYISAMHVAQIDKLSPVEALAYFTAHSDEIDFRKQGDLRKALERNIEIDQAKSEARAKEAAREAEERLLDSAWSLYAQGQPVPPSVISALPGRQAVQLMNAIESRAAREARGTKVETNIGAYLDVREAIERGERVDLRQFDGVISPTDIKSLASLSTPGQAAGFLTDAELKNKALVDLGIDKKRDPTSAYTVLGLIDSRMTESAQAKGKPLTPDEKRAVIEGVVTDRVYVDGWSWRDKEKQTSLLSDDEVGDAYVLVGGKKVKTSVVPFDKRLKIIRALRARGLPETEQVIVETYIEKYPDGQERNGGVSGGW